jgi:hypothetical protein
MRCSLTCVAGTLPKKDSRNMHRAPGGRRSALSQFPAVARGRSQSLVTESAPTVPGSLLFTRFATTIELGMFYTCSICRRKNLEFGYVNLSVGNHPMGGGSHGVTSDS